MHFSDHDSCANRVMESTPKSSAPSLLLSTSLSLSPVAQQTPTATPTTPTTPLTTPTATLTTPKVSLSKQSVLREHHGKNTIVVTQNTIPDKKIMEAASQLIDIYVKRPPHVTPTDPMKSSELRKVERIKQLRIKQQRPIQNNILSNFVVTKVTEKMPTTTNKPLSNNTMSSSKLASPTALSPVLRKQANNEKMSIPKEKEKTHWKNVVEIPHKHSIHIEKCVKMFPAPRSKSLHAKLNDFHLVAKNRHSLTNDASPKSSLSPSNQFRSQMRVNRFGSMTATKLPPNIRSQHLVITPITTSLADAKTPRKITSSNIARPVSVTVRKITTRTSNNRMAITVKSSAANAENRAKEHLKTLVEPSIKRSQSTENVSSSPVKLPCRRFSDFAGIKSQRLLFSQKIAENNQYFELYSLCSDVVSQLRNPFTVRKKGRPKKAQYSNKTRALLCTPEFSTMADRRQINMEYYGSDRISRGLFDTNISPTTQNKSLTHGKPFALLSIEPVIERSLRKTQTPKVYAQAKSKQLKQMTTTKESHQQETANDLYDVKILHPECHNDITLPDDSSLIEYLEDESDNIESPAYEPVVARSFLNNEPLKLDMLYDINQISNTDALLASEEFEHMHTNTLSELPLLNVDVNVDFNDRSLFSGIEAQTMANISPQRKNGRKRKISNEYVHFIKRNATNTRYFYLQ